MIDSRRYRGRLRLDADGLLLHGRHLLVPALRTTLWEADQADEVLGVADLRVAAVMAVDGTKVPWGRLQEWQQAGYPLEGATVDAQSGTPGT